MIVRMTTSLAGHAYECKAKQLVKVTKKTGEAWIRAGMAEEPEEERVTDLTGILEAEEKKAAEAEKARVREAKEAAKRAKQAAKEAQETAALK
jgi:ATP:corrinoid adenosyltransferase